MKDDVQGSKFPYIDKRFAFDGVLLRLRHILKQYLLKATAARPYFDATIDSPLEAFEGEAPRHPVFQITTAEEPTRQERSMKETE
jgi:hypothetical protein